MKRKGENTEITIKLYFDLLGETVGKIISGKELEIIQWEGSILPIRLDNVCVLRELVNKEFLLVGA